MKIHVEPYAAIGKRIKSTREQKGVTQEALAEKIGMSVTHINNLENAHSKASLTAFLNIANALDVSLDVLACDCVYRSKAVFIDELGKLVKDADDMEIRVIVDVVRALLDSMRKQKES